MEQPLGSTIESYGRAMAIAVPVTMFKHENNKFT
jgi:hypothetical protein